MEDNDLRNLLERLHAEIERNEPLDEQERELLKDLGVDIRDLLDRTEGEGVGAEDSMIERLEESIDRFEVNNPELTLMLNQLLSILSGAGI